MNRVGAIVNHDVLLLNCPFGSPQIIPYPLSCTPYKFICSIMKYFLNIARIIVGVLFIFSGLVKANDPLGLSYKMQEFFEI